MDEIEEIIKAEHFAKEAKEDFEDMVSNYIKANVNKEDRASIDSAIVLLPECEAKLALYDMMYDLNQKTNEEVK